MTPCTMVDRLTVKSSIKTLQACRKEASFEKRALGTVHHYTVDRCLQAEKYRV